jgi:hypothetical protein
VWRAWVLEVTESLEEALRGRELRGETWTLFRVQKNGKTDPVQAVYCERVPESKLSTTFDILPVLLRLFHVSSLRLGAANPLPPKIMMEPVAGDAPTIPADLLPKAEERPDPEARKKLAEMLAEMRGGNRTAGNGQTSTHANNGR